MCTAAGLNHLDPGLLPDSWASVAFVDCQELRPALMALPSGASLQPIVTNPGGGRLRDPTSEFVDRSPGSPELPRRKFSRIAEVRGSARCIQHTCDDAVREMICLMPSSAIWTR